MVMVTAYPLDRFKTEEIHRQQMALLNKPYLCSQLKTMVDNAAQ